MSIQFSGRFFRPGGQLRALGRHIDWLNLKAVKRISVQFDPFADKVDSTREFLFHLSVPKVQQTNQRCILKTNIVCDRSDPYFLFDLIPKVQDQHQIKSIKIISKNLTTLELLELFNKHITPLAPAEEVVKTLKTKGTKRR